MPRWEREDLSGCETLRNQEQGLWFELTRRGMVSGPTIDVDRDDSRSESTLISSLILSVGD